MKANEILRELKDPKNYLVVSPGYAGVVNEVTHRREKIQPRTAASLIESGKVKLERKLDMTNSEVYRRV